LLIAYADRTNTIIFQQHKAKDICGILNNMHVEKVQDCRYTGIFIDDTLTWSCHIDFFIPD